MSARSRASSSLDLVMEDARLRSPAWEPLHPAAAVQRRVGTVLLKNTILKVRASASTGGIRCHACPCACLPLARARRCTPDIARLSPRGGVQEDHFPAGMRRIFDHRVTGAPNFRQVPGTTLWGVGQPTLHGVRAILNHLGTRRGDVHQRVLWINLREEPLVYINMRPFVLRDAERVFSNIGEYSGITAERLEDMEWRMKEDIVREAERQGGNIVVHEETEDRVVLPSWESIAPGSVYTPMEGAPRRRAAGAVSAVGVASVAATAAAVAALPRAARGLTHPPCSGAADAHAGLQPALRARAHHAGRAFGLGAL